MRYTELNITTQRQAPARARSEGAAMLRRAGYLLPGGELTALGARARLRLKELTQTMTPGEFFQVIRLPAVKLRSGEFCYTIQAGKSEILACEACGYAASRAEATVRKRLPQPEAASPLEKVPTPETNTIEALARYLGIAKEKTAKALMYMRMGDKRFVFVVIRGDMQLSEAKLKAQVGEVRAATAEEIIAAGAAPGYASPVGLQGALIVADDLIPQSPNLVAGANEAGFHLLNTNYGRDYTAELVADLVLPDAGAPCPDCGAALRLLNADVLFAAAGYGLEATLEALAETHHDEKGLTWPAAAAPFDVYLMNVPGKELDTRASAAELHDAWEQAGLRVLLDDRDERAGVKFADADLIGLPVRATLGERALQNGMVELKPRTGKENQQVPLSDALSHLQSLDKAT